MSFQFAMLWMLAPGLQRPGMLVGGGIVIALSMRRRQARWRIFLLYVAVVMVIGYLVQ